MAQANKYYIDAWKCKSTEQKAAAIIYGLKYSQLLRFVYSQTSSGASQYPQNEHRWVTDTEKCDCE